ncbi:hypothetical protein N7468_007572, partial [Penicillium chermesinum]
MTRNRFLTGFMFSMILGCQAESSRFLDDRGVAYGFDHIQPSASLKWTPCFDAFTCAKLEVPLDYSNRDLGKASIAFIKLAGKNATVDSPSIVLIPGGPGGSGVDLLLSFQTLAGPMIGEEYNFVSFDPRGVNNSDLVLDCFSGDSEARSAFNRVHNTGVTNVSSTSVEEQYYSSSIYGEWCNNAVKTKSPHGYYVTTPAVAHDLLTFIEAEAELIGRPPSDAKLWSYGVSFGTVTGVTFASMFPDRVERMVLDGVLNAEQYYQNVVTDNVDQLDLAIEKFSSFCHSAGSKDCSFWGPTTANITARLNGIIDWFRDHPVPISGVQSRDLPTMVTYSDLKALFLNSLYTPLSGFPTMADTLRQIELGNVSTLAGAFEGLVSVTSDARFAIECTDSYRTNRLSTIEEFQNYAEYTTSKSKYIGDLAPVFLNNILCRSFRPQLPDSMVFQALTDILLSRPEGGNKQAYIFPDTVRKQYCRSYNSLDIVCFILMAHFEYLLTFRFRLARARKASSRFPGSKLLLQEAIG